MSTVRVEMGRHRSIRLHSTFTADVPVEMLTDATYFDEFGNPTSAFDQWMCDNGDESGVVRGDDGRGDDLDYEVETIDGEDAHDFINRLGMVQCPNCGEWVEPDEMKRWPNLTPPVTMCDSCEHDARRSGWEPGQ